MGDTPGYRRESTTEARPELVPSASASTGSDSEAASFLTELCLRATGFAVAFGSHMAVASTLACGPR